MSVKIVTERQTLTKLKFDLLASGMRVSDRALSQLDGFKNPIRARSGASGGLDVILSKDVYVNVPVNENFAKLSPFKLDYNGETFILRDATSILRTVQLLPIPKYYELKTADKSEDMVRIGQMCSPDRFCYGMTGPGCYFWSSEKRCKFCSIGNNYSADASKKKEKHLLEVIQRAVNDNAHPAKHILIGGGTSPGQDMGATLASRLTRKIKKEFDISIYVMIAAPLKNEYLDELYNSGVDELGINMEFWSSTAWNQYIPGKNKEIGKERYLEALEYAVSKFGPIKTRSILIAGLESPEYTIEGSVYLASMGVMPILSPFRPLNGTYLADHNGFDGNGYFEIFSEIESQIKGFEIPLGPTCICCQNNTLAMPYGNQYKRY